MIPDLGVIIAAGGSSQRYGERNKLLEMLGGLPVLLHSVRNFSPLVAPGNLIVAAGKECIAEYAALAENENVTEQLKIDDPSEWVAHMNNIHVRAMEIVNAELIYA